MTEAVWIAAIAALTTLAVSVVNTFQIKRVHNLANSRLTEALDRIVELEKLLSKAK